MQKPEELVKIITDAQKATDYIKEHMLVRDMEQEQNVNKGLEVKSEKPLESPKAKEAAPVVVVKKAPKGKDMER